MHILYYAHTQHTQPVCACTYTCMAYTNTWIPPNMHRTTSTHCTCADMLLIQITPTYTHTYTCPYHSQVYCITHRVYMEKYSTHIHMHDAWIPTHTHTHIHMPTHIHTHTHTYTHTHPHSSAHRPTHMHAHTHTHTLMHTPQHTHTEKQISMT